MKTGEKMRILIRRHFETEAQANLVLHHDDTLEISFRMSHHSPTKSIPKKMGQNTVSLFIKKVF